MNARVWCLRRARGASACSIKCSLMIRYPGDTAPPGALVSDAPKVVLRYKWRWSPRTRTANYLSEGAPVSDSCFICAQACSHRLRRHARPEPRCPSTLPSFGSQRGLNGSGLATVDTKDRQLTIAFDLPELALAPDEPSLLNETCGRSWSCGRLRRQVAADALVHLSGDCR